MAEQLFQIGIKGLIRDEQGRVLLVKIPDWGDNAGHWDMPGGRMDPGETFVQTLRRELMEEISVEYDGQPKHVATVLSSITIPVGDIRVPLVLMAYEVTLPDGAVVVLDPNGNETEFDWFEPRKAAQLLATKYTPDFCELVAKLQ